MKTILMLMIMLFCTSMIEAQTLESILAGYHKAIGGKDKYPQQSAVIIKAQTQGGGGGSKLGAFSPGRVLWIPNQ